MSKVKVNAIISILLLVSSAFTSFAQDEPSVNSPLESYVLLDNQEFGMDMFASGGISSTLTIDDIFTGDGEVDININEPIYSLSLNADVNLLSSLSLVRVILVDQNSKEYLVYEGYPLIISEGNHYLFNICEETCALEGVTPDYLKIIVEDATINIDSLSYADTYEDLSTDVQSVGISSFNNKLNSQQISHKISKINQNIQRKGLRWTAGRIKVSELSYEEKKKLLALPEEDTPLPNLQGFEYYKGGIFEIESENSVGSEDIGIQSSSLPASWDWRKRHGENWITPVRGQGTCASCWAFAAIGVTEGLTNLYYNQHIDIDISEQDSVCRHGGSCRNGGSLQWTYSELQSTGLVDESCYPTTNNENCPGRCGDASSRLWKISNYGSIGSDDNSIKRNLIENGPISYGILSWWHFMTLVGYGIDKSSGKTAWVFKNSWGDDWGDDGYANVVVSPGDRYSISKAEQPFFSPDPNEYDIACRDNDGDGYCNWGLTVARPESCPDNCSTEKDCKDDDIYSLGFDSNYNCITLEAPCGDGLCNGDETCETCEDDCGICDPYCGDGICNNQETCSSCAQDCGSCPPRCGDGQCNGDETCLTCYDCQPCGPSNTCIDSDGPNAYEIFGNITLDYGVFYDTCITEIQLYEKFCYQGNDGKYTMGNKIYNCPGACLNGKCITPDQEPCSGTLNNFCPSYCHSGNDGDCCIDEGNYWKFLEGCKDPSTSGEACIDADNGIKEFIEGFVYLSSDDSRTYDFCIDGGRKVTEHTCAYDQNNNYWANVNQINCNYGCFDGACLAGEGDAKCGDGICNGFENCEVCEFDCGDCLIEAECGNLICEFGEDVTNCFMDCSSRDDCNSCDAICSGLGAILGEFEESRVIVESSGFESVDSYTFGSSRGGFDKIETRRSSETDLPPGYYLEQENEFTIPVRILYDDEPKDLGLNIEEKIDVKSTENYIIKFKDDPVIIKAKELETEAEENEVMLDGMAWYNPTKYVMKPFLLEPDEVEEEIKKYDKKLERENERAKVKIEDILGKELINEITGNAIGSEQQVELNQEFQKVLNGISINISKDEAIEIKKLDFVDDVFEDKEVKVSLMDSIGLMNADDAWNLGYTGEGVKIAILDTGIDYTHPDLGGCFGEDLPGGRNFNPTKGNSGGGNLTGFCGDGTCGPEETQETCPEDCSVETDHSVCQNAEDQGLCNGLDIVYGQGYELSCCCEFGLCWTEECASCGNFCGDSTCNYNETFENCPNDCEKPTCKVMGGYDFINNDEDPMDDHGHGTHCAATAAGNGLLKGVAPDAKLYAYKVLGSGGSGSFSQVIAGIERAVDPNQDGNFDDRVDVISMSLGANCGSSDPEKCGPLDPVSQAVDNAVDAGITVVIAAGNSGPYSPTIGSPGVARKAITVGAMCKPSQIGEHGYCDEEIARFSSRGPTYIGDIKPDVVALGVDICAAQYDEYQDSKSCIDEEHIAISGTSMATPHVAGAAALIVQAHPEWNSYQIKDVIRETAIDLGYDENSQGKGKINLMGAVQQSSTPPTAILDTNGKIDEYTADIRGTAISDSFNQYFLEYADQEALSWIGIASSDQTVERDILFENFDLSNLNDGYYTLRLTVLDSFGNMNQDISSIKIDRVYLSSPVKNKYTLPGYDINITGTVSGPNLDYYIIEWGRGMTPLSWQSTDVTLANNGEQEIIDGFLGKWDTASITEADYYSIRLTVYHTNGNQDTETTYVYLDPSSMPGWPQKIVPSCNNFICYALTKSPTAADIDSDGEVELLVAMYNVIKVYEPDGSNTEGWPQLIPDDIAAQISPAAGDLDGDGYLEVVVSTNYGDLYVYNHDGSLVEGWPKFIGGYLDLATIKDMDDDGTPEIIIGAWNKKVHVLDINGNELPGWPKTLDARFDGSSVGDLDGDGLMEIVASDTKDVYIFGHDGTLKNKLLAEGKLNSIPAIGDIDGDSDLEIIVGTMENLLYAWHHDGTDVYGWPKTLVESIYSSPALGDLDGDGDIEIVVGTDNVLEGQGKFRYLYALNHDGTILDGWPIKRHTGHSFFGFGSASIADIDNDGLQEIVVNGDEDGYLEGKDYKIYAFNYDGTVVDGWPKKSTHIAAFFDNAPSIIDLDGDGTIEIAYISKAFDLLVINLEDDYNDNLIDWPMLRHDASHSGNFEVEDSGPNAFNEYLYYELHNDDCTVNLTVTSSSGEATLFARWTSNVCDETWDENMTIVEETKSLVKEGINQGIYSLKLTGHGNYDLEINTECFEDRNTPEIEIEAIPEYIKDDIIITAEVSDSNGLGDCYICISEDNVCDTEWTEVGVIKDYEHSDRSGQCTYYWNITEIDERVYTISFKIEDVVDNSGESDSQTTLVDKTGPNIQSVIIPQVVEQEQDIAFTAIIFDNSVISNVTVDFNDEYIFLEKDNITGLYEGELSGVMEQGIYNFIITVFDIVGNKAEKIIPITVEEKIEWADEAVLTFDQFSSLNPDIVVDSDENKHIVWEEYRDGNSEIYYNKLREDNNILKHNVRLTDNIYNSRNPSIAVDSDNNLHVVWQDDRNGNKEIYYSKLNNDGNVLIDNKRLTYNLFSSEEPKVLFEDEELHILWLDDRDGLLNIYYKKIDLQGNIVVIDKRISSENIINFQCSIKDGIIGVVAQNNQNEVYLVMLDRSGNSENENVILSPGINPDIVMTDNANVIFQTVSKDIQFSIFDIDGEMLTNISDLTDKGKSSNPSLIIDTDQRLHLTWSDNRFGRDELYYSKLDANGTTLITPKKITENATNASFPIIAVGSINIIYNDNQDGSNELFIKTTETEIIPPVISSVEIRESMEYSARITWQTDEPTTSVVNYGPNIPLENKYKDSILKNYHEVILSNLAPSVNYYFEVESRDAFGNLARDNNNGFYHNFETKSTKNRPELPTTFYGRVIYDNGTPASDLIVSAIWEDSDEMIHNTSVKTLNYQEAIELNDESIIGYYIYNLGNIKAKAGSKITVSVEGDLTDPDPYVFANPGGSSTQVTGGPIVLDINPPKITINSPEERTYNTPFLTFNFEVDELIDWAAFKLNDQDLVTVTDAQNEDIEITAKLGENTLTVYARDLVDISNEEEITFYVEDGISPEVSVGDFGRINGFASLSANVSDITNSLDSTCEVCLSNDGVCDTEWKSASNIFSPGDKIGQCGFIWDTNLEQDGTWTINFRLSDIAENIGYGLAKTAIIDNTAPEQITGLELQSIVGQSSLQLTWEQNGAADFEKYNVYRSLSEFSNIEDAELIDEILLKSTVSYTDEDLDELISYHYAVTAVDDLGNERNQVISNSAEVADITPPIINILSPEGQVYKKSDVVIEYTANEPIEICTYSVNGGEKIQLDSGIIVIMPEGNNNIAIECEDIAGNLGISPLRNFVINSLAPPKVTNVNLEIMDEDDIEITWDRVTESDVYGYKVYRFENQFSNVSGIPLIGTTETNSYTDYNLAQSETYYYGVTAVDLAANEDQIVETENIFVPDTVPPVVNIISPEDKTYDKNDLTLLFSVNEDSNCSYSINGGLNINVESGTDIIAFEGDNNIIVSCTDAEGNVGTDSIEFIVDTTPPEKISGLSVVFDENPNKMGLTWQQTDAVDFGKYKVYKSLQSFNEVNYATLIGTIDIRQQASFLDLNDLILGNTIYYAVTVEDLMGNEDKSVDIVSSTVIDSILPTITITSPINKKYNSIDIDLNYEANEEVSGCTYSLNGGAREVITEIITAQEGTNNIIVYCSDMSDNEGVSNLVTFTIDTVGPEQVSGLDVNTVSGQASLDLIWDAVLASDFSHYNIYRSLSEFSDVSSMSPIETLSDTTYLDINLASEETYYYAITAVDDAGNENKIVNSISGRVADKTPPDKVIGLSVNTIPGENSLDLTWESSSANDFDHYNVYRSDSNFNDVTGTESSSNDQETIRITDGNWLQADPVIYGDKIVYRDDRSGNSDIYIYDLSTGQETTIANTASSEWFHSIYDDKIVWEKADIEDTNIFMYDLSTGETREIATGPGAQVKPDIYGDVIVFSDTRNGNADIYMYDLLTDQETRITSDPKDQYRVAIYGNKIVWQDQRYSNFGDIFMYDISSGKETRITSRAGVHHQSPDIYENKIIWIDDRTGVYYLYLYDINTQEETSISGVGSEFSNPKIHSNMIVWDNLDSDNVFMYDISSEEISLVLSQNQQKDQMKPSVFNNKIVWFEYWLENGYIPRGDIYLTTLGNVDGITKIKSTDVNNFKDIGLNSEGLYYYAVTAVDTLGNEDKNVDSVRGNVADLTAPQITITSPSDTRYGSKNIELSYDTDEQVTNCKYSLNNEPLVIITPTIAANEGTNIIKVVCDDNSGNTGESGIVEFVTDTTAPGSLPGLTVDSISGETSLELNWDQSQDSDLSYYKIYRSRSDFSDVSSMEPITTEIDSSHKDIGLESEGIYYYAVTAIDDLGNENTNVVSVSGRVSDLIPPEQITGLNVNSIPGEASLVLSWLPSNADDLAGYNVYRNRQEFTQITIDGGENEFDIYHGGGLRTQRSGPAVAQLNDGRVLVAGGYWSSALFGQSYLSSTEIISLPEDKNSEATGELGPRMTYERRWPSAITMNDGRVLVTGGIRYSTKVGTAEVFDPNANGGVGEFTVLEGACGPEDVHLYEESLLLNDGRVLLVGGYTDTAEIFDPSTGCFEEMYNLMESRNGHTATLLNDGRVLIIGDLISKKGEIFDPSSGISTYTTGDMSYSRSHHDATLLNDGRVLITGGKPGGDTAEIYDPETDSFTLLESRMSSSRNNHDAYLLSNGRVAIIAGKDDGDDELYNMEVFDPETEAFTLLEYSLRVEPYHDSIKLNDGRIYIAGGLLQGSAISDIFELVDSGTSLITSVDDISQTSYVDNEVLSENTYYYAVSAFDEDGNEDKSVVSVSGTVADLTPPIVTITSPENNESFDTKSVDLDFDVNEENVDCTYSLKSGPKLPIASTLVADEGINTIKVFCTDDDGNEGQSSLVIFVVDTTSPDQITGIEVITIKGKNELNLSWEKSTANDFGYYTIYRSESDFEDVSSATELATIHNVDYTKYNDAANLIGEMIYYYAVTATDELGNENENVDASFGIVADTNPPGQISGLIINTVPGENSLELAWDESPAIDLSYYKVYRSNVQFSNVNLMDPIVIANGTTYEDPNLESEGIYYYGVTAIDINDNENKNLASVSGIVADTIAPNITIISPENAKYSTGIISLDYVANEKVIDCIYSINSGPEVNISSTIEVEEGYYSIQVSCEDDDGNEGSSDIVSFIVDLTSPSQVVGLTIDQVPKQPSLNLTWNPNSEEDLSYYKIYRSLESFNNVENLDQIATTKNSHYKDDNLDQEEVYYYAVSAVDDVGNEMFEVITVSSQIVDLDPPIIRIFSPLPDIYSTKNLEIIYMTDEPVSWCVYYLNEGANASINGSANIVAEEGDNDLKIQCSDVFDNVGINEITFNVDSQSPPKIQSLRITNVPGENSLQLDWDPNPASDLLEYRIYRSLANFTDVSEMDPIASLTANSHKDTGLISERTYHYAVTGVDVNLNENKYVNSVLGIVADTIPPEEIKGLKVERVEGEALLNISWYESNASDFSYYNIYKSTNIFSDVSSNVPIVTNYQETNYIDFNVEDGKTYYYAVTAVDEDGNEISFVIPLSGTTLDFTSPDIYVRNVGSRVIGEVILSAIVFDDGVGLKESCEICLVNNGTCDNQWISANVVNNFNEGDNNGSCMYTWQTDEYVKGKYNYNFRVSDLDGNVGEGQHIEAEIINASGIAEFHLNLRSGWNLISFPVIPIDQSSESVFGPIAGSYTRAYYFNSDSKTWEVYNSNRTIFDQENNLLQISPGKSYWIEMKEPFTLKVHGFEVSEDYESELKTGWNYIGYPYLGSTNISWALDSLVDNYNKIYSYNPDLEKYDVYNIHPTLYEPNTITRIENGKGYLIDIKSNDVWEP